MSIARKVRGHIEAAKRQARQAVRKARDESVEGTSGANVARRTNVVTATNVGSPGSSHAVTASQRVHIRQSGGQTYEEVDETRTIESSERA